MSGDASRSLGEERSDPSLRSLGEERSDETKRPSASVIVPSYRGAARLPALLECLAAQDFAGRWEIIVSLDGELDDSRAILAEYENRLPLRVIASPANRGVCATLNDGYAAATGDVLIRCDDDLSPQPHMVRGHVERHGESAVPLGVIGATRDVFADTPFARAYGLPANRRHLQSVYQRGADAVWMHWAAHNSVTRDTWDRVGGFDPRFAYGEDSELGFRLHEAGVRMVVDRALEIEHRGAVTSAAERIPRAFVSGTSRRVFERAHPGHRHENQFGGSIAARIWSAGVATMALTLRSPAVYRRFGRIIDALPAGLPLTLRGRLIALGVESAGRAGYRHGASDLSTYAWAAAWSERGILSGALSERSETKRPHTLWLVPVPELGGVARHVLDATRIGIPGWRMTVLCPDGVLADRLRAQGSAVVTAPFGPAAGIRASRRSLSRTASALRPDIVHSHLAYADIINAWTRLPRQTSRFTTEHGIAGDDGIYHRSSMHAKVMAFIHRLRFPRFEGVIAVSRATREAMIAKWCVKQPIAVILNGVDLPAGAKRRDPASVTGLRLLSLSRLAPEKQIDRLIDAFALVRAEHSEATLTIAGEGPLLDELRLRDTDVRFPGFVDAGTAMQDADVIVQLSAWENCSYTLLDAVAHGLRVVASDVGGNSEILDQASLVAGVNTHQVAQAILAPPAAGESPEPASVADMCAAIAREYESVVK